MARDRYIDGIRMRSVVRRIFSGGGWICRRANDAGFVFIKIVFDRWISVLQRFGTGKYISMELRSYWTRWCSAAMRIKIDVVP